jgi:serine/threonine protein kinase
MCDFILQAITASHASAGLRRRQRAEQSLEGCCGTFSFLCRGYIAPEILKDEEFAVILCVITFFFCQSSSRFSFAADMYSLGVVAYQLASGGVFVWISELIVIRFSLFFVFYKNIFFTLF